MRTPALLITNQLLYQLSYTSITAPPHDSEDYISRKARICQHFCFRSLKKSKRSEKNEHWTHWR